MKIAFLLFSLLSASAFSAEEIRMWTDATGRTIRGTLKAKSETSATLTLDSGKTVRIPLEKLSKKDQDHVAKADLANPPKMIVSTVSAEKGDSTKTYKYSGGSYTTKTKESGDSRTISVKLSETAGKTFEIQVMWIGDDGDKSDYGVFKKISKDVSADGETKFTMEFKGDSTVRYDGSYRGYAVRLFDVKGVELDRQASQKPFERFLDEPTETVDE